MILSANMLSLLSSQYAHEASNALKYAALQSWADMRGLDGTASFFEKQSKGETDHANKVLAYIQARNEQLQVCPIDWNIAIPGSYQGAFASALEIERATTDKLYALKEQAEAERDLASCAWLMQSDGLILEQVEEERVIQSVIDRILVRTGALPILMGEDVPMSSETGSAVHDIVAWLKEHE